MRITDDSIHAVVDIETLGLSPTAQMLEIAAVVFTVSQRSGFMIKREFFQSCKTQEILGEESTIEWWKSSTDLLDAYQSMLLNSCNTHAVPQHIGAKNLAKFLAEHSVTNLWSQGKDFDFPILRYYYPEFTIDSGVPYANVHCARDLAELVALTGRIPKNLKSKVPHRAYGDAQATANNVASNLLQLKGR